MGFSITCTKVKVCIGIKVCFKIKITESNKVKVV